MAEHQSEDYKKVNRFQKVPAIIDYIHDNEFKLTESIAILRYLVECNKISANFYPTDFKQRAKVDEFLEWQHTAIRSSCSLYFRFYWVQEKLFGMPASKKKVNKYCKLMEKDLELMENLWLKETKFLAGNSITAADVFGACEIEQIRCCGYKIENKYSKTYFWIESVRQELIPYFDEAHQVIYFFEKEAKLKQQKC
ncbi:glutathione S-transferase theta-3-like [Cochliomyia hominivorax]